MAHMCKLCGLWVQGEDFKAEAHLMWPKTVALVKREQGS